MSLIVLLLGALAVSWSEVHACGYVSFSTDTNYYYRYNLPAVPPSQAQDIEVAFSVQASNDAFIALAPDPNSQDLYEIVIGGWNNGKSVIRRCMQCNHKVEANHTPLSEHEARIFIVSYRHGRVAVSTGDNPNQPFMIYDDPNPLTIGTIGFSTGWGSAGLFVFDTCYRHSNL